MKLKRGNDVFKKVAEYIDVKITQDAKRFNYLYGTYSDVVDLRSFEHRIADPDHKFSRA